MSLKQMIAESQAGEGALPKVRVEPISAGVLLSKEIESLPVLIDPIFPKVGVVCLGGSSDTGKSTFLRQMCLHVVTGEERFIGFPINAVHRRAIYVSTEDDSLAVSYLLNVQNRQKKYAPEQLDGLRYIFETEDLLGNLEYLLTEQPVDLVVIDCLADLFGGKGSLNESAHVRGFLSPYKELADRFQCLVVFLHHTGKRTDETEPSKRNLLGSQGIEAKMRLVIELRQDQDDPMIRHACIVKGNYLRGEYKNASFELRFDEHMLFYNTGNRRPFSELLKRSPERSPEQREHMIEQARTLASAGHSQRDIAKQLNLALGTVNGYLKASSNVHVQPSLKE